MKMFDRSTRARLGFFVVTLLFMSFYGNVAKAADEDHGNPGHFMENIRKGISGISKFFWSPKIDEPETQKAQKPVEQKSQDLSSNKPASITKPDTAKKTKTVGKSETVHKTKITHKNGDAAKVSKPTPAKVAVKTDEIQKTKQSSSVVAQKASKTKADKNKKSADGTKMKDALNAAVARNETAKAEKPASSVSSAPKTSKTTIVKPVIAASADQKDQAAKVKTGKQPSKIKTAKKITDKKEVSSLAAAASASKSKSGKTSLVEKAVGDEKAVVSKPAGKKHASVTSTKTLQDKTSAKANDGKDKILDKTQAQTKKLASKGSATAPVISSTKTVQPKVANNNAGTYIWVPNKGSPLGAQFGLTGIPADRLEINGDMNRTDGRWVFAPYRRGVLPSIYGLSDRIHAAGSAGVWVGSGRNWIYVFDKKRTYSSFLENVADKKTKASASSKTAKAASSGKVASSTEPVATAEKAPKKTENKKVIAAKGGEPRKEVTAPEGKQASPTSKEKVKTKTQASVKPVKSAKAVVKAPSGNKVVAVKGGNWSKVGGRWVYVPDVPNAANGQPATRSMPGLAVEVSKAPATGGWVQRNNRWIYVAPQNKTSAASPPADKKMGMKSQKSLGKPSAQNKAAGKVKAKEAGKTPGITIVQKSTVQVKPGKQAQAVQKQPAKIKTAPKTTVKPQAAQIPKAKTGLAEGPAKVRAGPSKNTVNQRVWVREKNRWVYAKEKSADSSGQALGQVSKKGAAFRRGLAGMGNSAKPQARNNTGAKPAAGKVARPTREFFFFVPGRVPGGGNWFAAPVEMMKKARRIQNPARANRR